MTFSIQFLHTIESNLKPFFSILLVTPYQLALDTTMSIFYDAVFGTVKSDHAATIISADCISGCIFIQQCKSFMI